MYLWTRVQFLATDFRRLRCVSSAYAYTRNQYSFFEREQLFRSRNCSAKQTFFKVSDLPHQRAICTHQTQLTIQCQRQCQCVRCLRNQCSLQFNQVCRPNVLFELFAPNQNALDIFSIGCREFVIRSAVGL